MPHDKNGAALKVGDIVTMRCKVQSVSQSENACNVGLRAIDGPEQEYKPEIACNARLVEKAK